MQRHSKMPKIYICRDKTKNFSMQFNHNASRKSLALVNRLLRQNDELAHSSGELPSTLLLELHRTPIIIALQLNLKIDVCLCTLLINFKYKHLSLANAAQLTSVCYIPGVLLQLFRDAITRSHRFDN